METEPSMTSGNDQYATPEAAGRRLLEYAKAVEHKFNWVHVEKVNGPFLFKDMAKPAQYTLGMNWLIDNGYIEMDPKGSGCFFTLTDKAKQE